MLLPDQIPKIAPIKPGCEFRSLLRTQEKPRRILREKSFLSNLARVVMRLLDQIPGIILIISFLMGAKGGRNLSNLSKT
jgi:hypothetical protein